MEQLYKFSDLYEKKHLIKMENIKGVYLYGFKFQNEPFILYYVGKGQIKKRLTSHIQNLLCGNSTIYKKDILLDFTEYLEEYKNYKEKSNNLKNHQIYYPYGNIKSIIWFKENFMDLKIHIDYMFENFKFSYIQIDDKEEMNNLEYHLISKIGLENLANISFPNHTKENLDIKLNIEDNSLFNSLEKYKNLKLI